MHENVTKAGHNIELGHFGDSALCAHAPYLGHIFSTPYHYWILSHLKWKDNNILGSAPGKHLDLSELS